MTYTQFIDTQFNTGIVTYTQVIDTQFNTGIVTIHKLLTQFNRGIVTIHKLFTHSLKRAGNGHLRRMKRHGKKTAARNGKHGGSIVWGKGALGKLTRWRQNVENVQIFSPEGFVFVVLSIFLPPPPPFLFCCCCCFVVVVVVVVVLLPVGSSPGAAMLACSLQLWFI